MKLYLITNEYFLGAMDDQSSEESPSPKKKKKIQKTPGLVVPSSDARLQRAPQTRSRARKCKEFSATTACGSVPMEKRRMESVKLKSTEIQVKCNVFHVT